MSKTPEGGCQNPFSFVELTRNDPGTSLSPLGQGTSLGGAWGAAPLLASEAVSKFLTYRIFLGKSRIVDGVKEALKFMPALPTVWKLQ